MTALQCLAEGCGRFAAVDTLYCHSHSKRHGEQECQVCGSRVGDGFRQASLVTGEYTLRFAGQKWREDGRVLTRVLQVCGSCNCRHMQRGYLLLDGSR